MSVIPLLAASGTIFLDARAHKTIYDGCQTARARGAAVKRFRFEDPDHLDELLRAERDPTRLVCMDGVNSMTGNAPDLRAFAAVARSTARCSTSTTPMASASSARPRTRPTPTASAATASSATPTRPTRTWSGRRLLEVLLVAAGLHRLPDRGQGPAQGRRAAVPVLRPVARGVAGHRARRLRCQRGARRRAARRARPPHAPRPGRLDRLDIVTPNHSGFPIIEIPITDHRRIDEVGRVLFDRGVYVTLAAYPLVPKTRSASASSSPRPTPTPRWTA
jgi:8-amino-7-oxononanoate synthase